MTKELKEIRDAKINEMMNVIRDYELRERDVVKSGKKTITNINGKEIVIHDDVIEFYLKRKAYIKDSMDYLFRNCKISRPEVIRRINYLIKKNERDFDMWIKLHSLKCAVRNF